MDNICEELRTERRSIIISFDIYADEKKFDNILRVIKKIDNEAARYMLKTGFTRLTLDRPRMWLSRFSMDALVPVKDVERIMNAIKDIVDFAEIELFEDDATLHGYRVENGRLIEIKGIFVPLEDADMLVAVFGGFFDELSKRLIKEMMGMTIDREDRDVPV